MIYPGFRTLYNRPSRTTHVIRTTRERPWKMGRIKSGVFIPNFPCRLTAEQLDCLSRAVERHERQNLRAMHEDSLRSL